MNSRDTSLYGKPRHQASSASKPRNKELSSASALAFSSQLSSLLDASSANSGSRNGTTRTISSGRARPRQKDDLFTVKTNKGVKKRAHKDLDDEEDEARARAVVISRELTDDNAIWKRSRRKMEEKARLYAAMKRGDVEDEAERHMVDFDRKWAEKDDYRKQGGSASSEGDSDSDDSQNDEDQEKVEYVDEFGRTRTGSRFEAAREEQRRRRQERAAHDLDGDRFTARPAEPSALIFGDTIQSSAFNPDAARAEAMASLAAKRDTSLTPPPVDRFDNTREIREKGVGFFAFSRDEEERQREMGRLEEERRETERRREEQARKGNSRREERKRLVEERKRAVEEERARVRAGKFLDDLGETLGTARVSEVEGAKDRDEDGVS